MKRPITRSGPRRERPVGAAIAGCSLNRRIQKTASSSSDIAPLTTKGTTVANCW
jgi:hypothetical protein